MEPIPLYLSISFILVIAATLFFLYKASRSRSLLLILVGWLIVQGIIGSTGFYTVTNTLPPRFLLTLLPPLAGIIYLAFSGRGQKLIGELDLRILTLLSVIRIPVEFILMGLYQHHYLPETMTFSGRNFDILSGLSAPLMYLFAFRNGRINKPLLLVWNVVCLVLVLNVLTMGILSAPTRFQQLAFDQPNIAILHMPFIWLPALVVPIVIGAHVTAIVRLSRNWRKADKPAASVVLG